MMGATDAVGTEAVKSLATMPELKQLTLLGRRPLASVKSPLIKQHKIDVLGQAITKNIVLNKNGLEYLQWSDS